MVFKNEYIYLKEPKVEKDQNLEWVEGMIPGKYILSWNFKCTTTQS